MKQSAVVAALALAVVVATAVIPAATVAGTVKPSKYTYQENVTSELVMSVGKFSVNVYKIANGLTMYYVSTSQCWSVPAGSGYEYWMVLTAKNGDGVYGDYVSTAWGISGSESRTWKLLSFNSTS